MATLIETNEYQTPITEELLSQYPEEVVQQFTEIVNIVPFIKNLINPNRPKIEDLPRDKEGRAIVDITNPPIYKDADYFRQPALFYLKNNCYTKLRPNSNPNSEYRKYWREELRRCREGLIRQSDGMYVTGFLYWFLNYCPMMVNFYKEGQKKAIRKESFGFFFEGIWWRSIYLYNAREQGHHAIELAKRGAHPYNQKVFTPLGWRKWKDIKIGDELYGTYGNITKVIDIPYDKECDVYKVTLRDGRKILASDEHLWKIEFHNKKKIQIMTTLELLKEYKRKRKISYRNPLGIEYVCSIPKNKGVEMPYNKTKVDAYTFGLLLGDGSFRYCSCYYTQDPKDLEVERKYIPYNIVKWKAKYTYRINIPNWHKILEEYGLYNKKSEDKFIPDEYKYNSKEVRLNLLKGLMDSNGTLDNKGRYIIALSSKRMIEDIAFICRSLGYNCSYTIKKTGYKVNGVIKECLPSYALTIFTRDIIANLPRKQKKEKVITNQYSINKELRTRIINIEYVGKQKAKCVTVDSKDNCYLIGDFVTTHNCAKSYFLATIMSHNLIVGESEATHKRCITVLTAAQKEYLKDDKDGTLNKFIPELSFVIDNTPFPNLLLKNSPNEMSWQMGYKKPNGTIGGSMNQVLGVSAKDNSDKLRGKRGWILYEEMGTFNGLLELYDVTRKSVEDGDYTFSCMYLVGCVCAGTKVWTIDGRNINIEELEEKDGIVGFTDNLDLVDKHLIRGITKEPIVSTIYKQPKECIRITLSNGNILECSIDHPILIQKGKYSNKKLIGYEEIFREAKKLKIGNRVLESRKINIFGNSTLFDARLIGMLIGDGSYGSSVKYCSEDKELQDYVKSKYECKVFRTHITKKGNLYEEFRVNGIRGKLNNIGILGQTKLAKRLPINYQTLNEDNIRLLLSGLYDTDGSICINKKDGYIYLTQSNKEILNQVQILWRKFGVIGAITKTNPTIRKDRKDRNPWFTLTISGRYNCLNAIEVLNLLVPHKRDKLLEIQTLYRENPSKKLQSYPTDVLMHRIINIENIGVREVYNLTAGLSHTYLANNIITHNTANNKESSFLSAKKLLYAPESYNIQSVPNVYDKKGSGKDTFGFFFPAYINRAGCYNKDGISDVIKALLQVLMARYKSKYGADPTSVLRVIAEDPITPAEAIIKVKDAYFPVASLQERADTLDKNPSLYDDIYVGELYTTGTGEIEFRPTDDIPIRTYPVDNDTKGALEIYSMPKKDREGKVFNDRYIIGVDPKLLGLILVIK